MSRSYNTPALAAKKAGYPEWWKEWIKSQTPFGTTCYEGHHCEQCNGTRRERILARQMEREDREWFQGRQDD